MDISIAVIRNTKIKLVIEFSYLVIVSHLTRTFSFHITTFFRLRKNYDQGTNSLFQRNFKDAQEGDSLTSLLFYSDLVDDRRLRLRYTRCPFRSFSQSISWNLDVTEVSVELLQVRVYPCQSFSFRPQSPEVSSVGIVTKTALSLWMTSLNSQTITFVSCRKSWRGARVL